MRRWLMIVLVVLGVALVVLMLAAGVLIRLNPGLPLSDIGLGADVGALTVPGGGRHCALSVTES